MKLLADASLPALNSCFSDQFDLHTFSNLDELHELIINSDILLCRATLKVDERLLANSSIRYVATATSGIDHLDTDYLTKKNIKWFAAPGSNASAVADYVVASIAWLQKNKMLKGLKAGVIGIGQVGLRVVHRLEAAGFDVVSYDPLKSSFNDKDNFDRLQEIYQCDLIAIHANLHYTQPYPSSNLVNDVFLRHLQPDTTIINASRGGIVNEQALLTVNKPLVYCTDVYLNEPEIDPDVINFATLCTPHIAGHSIEAKFIGVYKISEQLHQELGYRSTCEYKKNTPLLTLDPESTWQDYALSLYNPIDETIKLKNEPDKKTAFLSTRKSHTKRHGFEYYDNRDLDEATKKILGMI